MDEEREKKEKERGGKEREKVRLNGIRIEKNDDRNTEEAALLKEGGRRSDIRRYKNKLERITRKKIILSEVLSSTHKKK